MQITVVLPVYNEAAVLPALHKRLSAVLGGLGCGYEILAVNDGSQDASLDILTTLARTDQRLSIVSLARNFGQQAAFTAGLRYAQGDAVILMDSDLQDPPELIPSLIAKWKEGWEVVYAVRTKRKERMLKRAAYALYYRILARISDPPIPPNAGDFSLLSRRVVDLLNAMPERTRFLRGLRSWIGLPQAAIEYERAPRPAGVPKYTLAKLLRLGVDGFTAFSHTPLRLASLLGSVTTAVSLASLLVQWILAASQARPMPPVASIVLAVVFVGGVQLSAIGILGEYLGRIYDEVKQRPAYIVSQLTGAVTSRAAAGDSATPPSSARLPS
jgi:dolichol-phosphate mannosyltransferase